MQRLDCWRGILEFKDQKLKILFELSRMPLLPTELAGSLNSSLLILEISSQSGT